MLFKCGVKFTTQFTPNSYFWKIVLIITLFLTEFRHNNGKYNLMLCQSKAKLRQHREILAKSGYYAHWNDAMMQEILENDYEIVKTAQKTDGKLTD